MTKRQDFDLEDFFPFQVRIFYRCVTDAASRVYVGEYGLKPYEWRLIAVLGHQNSFTPNEIVERSHIDKVSVSRAISALRARGWIHERASEADARSKLISLSKGGKAAYDHLVPKMQNVEQQLLSALTEKEANTLRMLMAKLRIGAEPF